MVRGLQEIPTPTMLAASEEREDTAWGRIAGAAAVCVLVSNALILAAASLSYSLVKSPNAELETNRPFLSGFAAWDGGWYARVIEIGYSYEPGERSVVAFFPAYPLAASAVRAILGTGTTLNLVLTSNLCFLLAMCVFCAYLYERTHDVQLSQLGVLAAAFWPTSFFFRMAYSESMMLLAVVLVLWGVQRGWHPLWIAVIVGIGTATRPVGIALLLPLLVYLWRQYALTAKGLLVSAAALLIGCGGILLFCGYLHLRFGDPLAFVEAHHQWHVRPPVGAAEKAFALATLQPIRNIYDSSSPFYWRHHPPHGPVFYNLYFCNPLFLLITAVALAVGAKAKWLNAYDLSLGLPLLLIPYLTHNFETSMQATGRFMSVIAPCYLVFGHLLQRMPLAVRVSVLSLSAWFLAAYTALFYRWYWFV